MSWHTTLLAICLTVAFLSDGSPPTIARSKRPTSRRRVMAKFMRLFDFEGRPPSTATPADENWWARSVIEPQLYFVQKICRPTAAQKASVRAEAERCIVDQA